MTGTEQALRAVLESSREAIRDGWRDTSPAAEAMRESVTRVIVVVDGMKWEAWKQCAK